MARELKEFMLSACLDDNDVVRGLRLTDAKGSLGLGGKVYQAKSEMGWPVSQVRLLICNRLLFI